MSIENPLNKPSQETAPETEEIKSEEQTAKEQRESSDSESAESLEEREKMLKSEIAEGMGEFEENIENIESLAEDENMTPSLRERLLSSIDTISNKIQSRFLKHLGGTVALSGIMGLQEYLINTEQTIVRDGSILGDANEVVLAGMALYATIKGIQFAGHKIKEFGVRPGVKKGTVRGAVDAASYITQEREYADVGREGLDISHAEHMSLYDEHENIFKEEYAGLKNTWDKEANKKWKSAMKRVRTESSKVLAS